MKWFFSSPVVGKLNRSDRTSVFSGADSVNSVVGRSLDGRVRGGRDRTGDSRVFVFVDFAVPRVGAGDGHALERHQVGGQAELSF